MTKRRTDREAPAHLRETSGSWDRRFESGWFEGAASESLLEFVETHRDRVGRRALDLGCGRGRNLIPLARTGLEMTGLDLSASGLAIARQRLDAASLDARLVRGTTSALPFPDESFDFAVSIGTIHYNKWPGIRQTFSEVRRVLRPGSLFYFTGRSVNDTTHARRPIADRGFTAVDLEGSNRGIVRHYFTGDELRELAGEHGLSILSGPKERLRSKDEDPARVLARWKAVFRREPSQACGA